MSAEHKRYTAKQRLLNKRTREARAAYRAKIKKYKGGFYGSKAWLHLRNWAVKTYGSACLRCGVKPERLNGDHIKSFKLYPALRLDPHNIQVLCPSCNKWKQGRTVDFRESDLGDLYKPC